MWIIVAVALLLATNLVHSRVGRALQAIATDETSAAASGIPVATYKLRLFVLAAALAGLGGGIFTFAFLIVSPDAFPVVLSIEFVVMVAVGGLGNIYGAVVGTVAILYLEQKLRELGTRPDLFGWDLPDAAPTVFSFGVFGMILVAIMLFFPAGLLPALGDAVAGVRDRLGGAGGGKPRSEDPTAASPLDARTPLGASHPIVTDAGRAATACRWSRSTRRCAEVPGVGTCPSGPQPEAHASSSVTPDRGGQRSSGASRSSCLTQTSSSFGGHQASSERLHAGRNTSLLRMQQPWNRS